jgi:site-specific DNA-adenine methylase
MGKGIRYLGSKEKHSFEILKIVNKTVNSDRDTFYDLFAGGLAISVKAVDFGYKVIANDIKKEVIDLLKDGLSGKIKDYCMKLPTKENIKNAKGVEKYYIEKYAYAWMQSEKIGIIMNDGQYKKMAQLQEYMNNPNKENLIKLHKKFVDVPDTLIEKTKLKYNDRWKYSVQIRALINTYICSVNADFVKKRLNYDTELRDLVICIQNLQHNHANIPALLNLQNYKNNLKLYSKDYKQIKIIEPKKSIIYCDIPYENTLDYNQVFDHKEFYKWAKNNDCPVFISSYTIDNADLGKLQKIMSISKPIMSRNETECLYWNGIR